MYRMNADPKPELAEDKPLIVCERMGAVSWPAADLAFRTFLDAYVRAGRKVGSVSAYARPWIRTLPDDLAVEGDLTLDRCALETLPKGLFVRGYLALRGCAAWDGRIPADARIGQRVMTDADPDGVSLAEWRALHPNGER
jgi:hypothetical protein